MVELERSLRAARALAGPAARTLTEAVHGTRTELAALREAVEACEAEWWTDEIRDGLERIVAAHAARSRGADAAHQAVLSRLRDEADGRAAAEGAARAARAHAAELAGMVEVCERKLQRYCCLLFSVCTLSSPGVVGSASTLGSLLHALVFLFDDKDARMIMSWRARRLLLKTNFCDNVCAIICIRSATISPRERLLLRAVLETGRLSIQDCTFALLFFVTLH